MQSEESTEASASPNPGDHEDKKIPVFQHFRFILEPEPLPIKTEEIIESSTSPSLQNFRDPLTPAPIWPPDGCLQIAYLLKSRSFQPKIRRRRKPVFVEHKPKHEKVTNYDHPMPTPNKMPNEKSDIPCNQMPRSKFTKREITTIHEESFQFKKKHSKYSGCVKAKEYKERVASLRMVVHRLRGMCLAKPRKVEVNFLEDTVKDFKKIKI